MDFFHVKPLKSGMHVTLTAPLNLDNHISRAGYGHGLVDQDSGCSSKKSL